MTGRVASGTRGWGIDAPAQQGRLGAARLPGCRSRHWPTAVADHDRPRQPPSRSDSARRPGRGDRACTPAGRDGRRPAGALVRRRIAALGRLNRPPDTFGDEPPPDAAPRPPRGHQADHSRHRRPLCAPAERRWPQRPRVVARHGPSGTCRAAPGAHPGGALGVDLDQPSQHRLTPSPRAVRHPPTIGRAGRRTAPLGPGHRPHAVHLPPCRGVHRSTPQPAAGAALGRGRSRPARHRVHPRSSRGTRRPTAGADQDPAELPGRPGHRHSRGTGRASQRGATTRRRR
jgi:hypothetical protein